MPKVLSVYENTVIISRMRRSMLFLWKVERIIENMNAVGIKCRHFRESLSAETHCQPHQHYEIKLNIEWRVQYIQKHGVQCLPKPKSTEECAKERHFSWKFPQNFIIDNINQLQLINLICTENACTLCNDCCRVAPPSNEKKILPANLS